MRVARLYAAGDLRVEEAPDPEPREGHTRVQVGAVGLCGSDLHWFTEGGIGDARLDKPLIPGHEVGGLALDGPHEGRLVAVDPAIPCWNCDQCYAGNPNLCRQIRFAGHAGLDGGMAEVISWPTSRLVPVPGTMTSADIAVLEPLGVAIHAWDLGDVQLADRVAVVGAGPIGLLLTQLASSLGCPEVSVVEPVPHRRAAARQLGATAVLDPAEVTPELASHDVVFEVNGNPAPVAEAIELSRPAGRVCLVGIPDHDVTAFPAAAARRKGLTIMCVRRMKEVYHRAICLVEAGIVDPGRVVSDRFALTEAAAAFDHACARRGLKVIVEPHPFG
ncbi:MAG: zinc-binding dehydrogenase [Arachnia sp.]